MLSDRLDTGELETVYYFTVEDYHTDYVGQPIWGFALWAHNADCVWDPKANRWRDPKTGKFTNPPEEKPELKKPGTRFNPDGTPKDPLDQLDQLREARNRGKLIEGDRRSETNAKKHLRDMARGYNDE